MKTFSLLELAWLAGNVLCAWTAFGAVEVLALPVRCTEPQTELEWQYVSLLTDLRDRNRIAALSNQTFRTEALILPSDRDPADVVARRTTALLADLQRSLRARRVNAWQEQLRALQIELAGVPTESAERRYELYEKFCALRHQIAFSNPLLNFREIVFIKRHRSLFNHMCDQYYGITAQPGGGLYILSDPFGSNPAVRDVLANSTVGNSRLAGKKLNGTSHQRYHLYFDGEGNLSGDETEGGSFLSPEVSYDGKSILFAYVECAGERQHRFHTDSTRGHWAEGRCYHIFQVNIDGSGLRQLTDGTWNDFSPCWLPNGRIAFISERRGGYLRCGRVCPTYTLFDMAADGSDINCLSVHETNEWDPSVTHDGRIVWTRWDYVDRHGCTAHMPWMTTLDGRDPRPVHGNYAPRHTRPDMELNVRAIPGSHTLVATAAPHHGQAFGSLIMVDPEVADDDGMAPVKRLTPEVAFPESQDGAEAFGTAWPLSENYYLCAYDLRMPPGNHVGQHLKQYPNNYGIYLVDSFGNKELIYRDPEISCLSPIPLRARPKPPLAALATASARINPAMPTAESPEATVSVLNVYDSLLPWPEGTKIKALRVLQVLPMTVPSGAPPHETGLRIASAGDSVVPVRHVLGTAPVEEDGSAHLVVPANRELFFQALDERGLAVQSMRSATALRAGEHLTCQGCHAPAQRAPRVPATMPLAMRRPPSRLHPDVDGSNPFSYPRLVQPVLDRNCVACHEANHGQAVNLGREPLQRKWYASYSNLTPRFGFFDYGDSYRTTPGRFGARASKLLALLDHGHYDVKLTEEDLHRLTLWLDCGSMFYGVYEKEGGEAQLRGEIARPTLE
jgi:Hydrazine synthase alpha subunit middle domain/WD40-like Beta Propeller Repeat